VADDRFLHLQRGVLGHRHVARHQRGERRAARLAEQQCGLRIDVDEHDLDRREVRPITIDHLAHTVEQHLQSQRQLPCVDGSGPDRAARDIVQFGTDHVDDAEAGRAQAWVDAEDPYGAHTPKYHRTE
jgi:hypothetical protein